MGGWEDEGVVLPDAAKLDAAAPVTIRIDTEAAGHPVHREVLGTNHNWYWSDLYGGADTPDGINPDFVEALRGVPIPLARMSGTGSQMFNWKQAVGPVAERTPQKTRPSDKEKVMRFGPLEWVKSTAEVDPRAEFAWVLNLTEDSPADHADIAELLQGDGKSNPNGGRDWAKVRMDYGIQEPVPVYVWELGNELEHDRWGITYEQYHTWCRDAIDAIRAVDPDARFAALAATSPWRPTRDPDVDWKDWHRSLLRDFGDELDFLVFHPYYHGINAVRMTKYMQEIEADIVEITGSDRIKLYISEHARWPGRSEPTEARPRGDLQGWQTHSLEGCLATSEFFNLSYNDPFVVAMGYHNLSGGPWNVVKRDDKTRKFFQTAMADLLRLYDEALGETVLPVKVEGVQADVNEKDLSFSTLAMRDGDELVLMMTNRDGEFGRVAQIDAGSTHRVTACRVMSADSLDSYDTVDARPVGVVDVDVEAEPLDLENFYVPPRSVTVLRLAAG